jgi:DNA-binding NtrC family response regulator
MEKFPIKILIADDEKNVREVFCNELSAGGEEVDEAENGLRTLELLENKEYDVLLLDLNMPGLGGIDVLKKMKSLDIPTEVIILTANATISTAVEAMKLGAYDYLTKPFRLEELSPIIEKAFEKKKLRSENILLRTQIKQQTRGQQLITKSPLMLGLLATVNQVATTDYPVLITGETGTGKEHIARIIHSESPRAERTFVAINCGALPESMIESELFGYEKGAFTGAHARKPGLLEIAHNGTLFLDEIGDMPAPLQVKLLRVIETGSFFRLGGTREMKINVRLVSATNKNLQAEIEKGAFRQDLFYRITTLVVHVPPLRERREDIPVLIEHFIGNSQAFKHKSISKEAITILSDYTWPGNVRELQNVIHRVLLLSKGDVIAPHDLPDDLLREPRSVTGSKRLEEVEREHILQVMKDVGGQKGTAAEALGIDPKTLYRKLSAYGRDQG